METRKIELDLTPQKQPGPPGDRSGKPLYVVSGFMRTGTSMMMRALVAGGLDACYRESRDRMKDRHKDQDYDPNKGGLYELEKRDYQRPDFPHGYEGYLIKGLNYCVPRMNVMPAGIRIVFMRRDAEEIRQSYDAFFGRPLRNIENLDRNMESVIDRIKNRRDVLSINVFWFRQVVKAPLSHFDQLTRNGWPIDPLVAAGIIDPELCRFRREQLTVGVM